MKQFLKSLIKKQKKKKIKRGMSHKQYVKIKRKFYDYWTLILFLISYVCSTILVVILTKEKFKFIMFTKQERQILLKNLSIVLSSLFFTVYSLRFYAHFFTKIIYLSLFLSCICLNIYILNLNLLILSILFWILCFCIYVLQNSFLRYLEVVKKIINIIAYRKICFLTGSILITGLIYLQIFLFLSIYSNIFHYKFIIYVWIIFNLLWSIFNTFYMLKVLATLVVAYHFINIEDKKSTIINDVIHGFYYTLGSCSFGGLVISIIYTLKYLLKLMPIKKERKKQKISKIINFIFFYILNRLQNIVQNLNSYTIPYLAIHGEGYLKSLHITYNLHKRDIFLDFKMKLLNFILSGLTFLVLIICIVSNIFNKKTFDMITLKSIIIFLMPMILFIIFVTIISSSFLALIYIYDDIAELIKDSDQELYSILRYIKLENY